MTSPLLGITTDLVTLALDAASARQQVIAHNIANANTPGYIPYETRFDSQLDQLRAKLRNGENLSASDLQSFKPQIVPLAQESDLSPKVALDMEAAKLSESVLQYQAVTRAYNQMTSLLNIAINEGKR